MRNHNHVAVAFVVALVMALVFVAPVAAQEGDGGAGEAEEILACTGENVAGTVVGVDGDVVTIDTGDGLCTVTLGGEYEHPIVALIGAYFAETNADDLVAAVEGTQGCAVYDAEADAWAWADCEDEGAVPVTIVSENEDGSFAFTATVVDENGDEAEVSGSIVIEDEEIAGGLSDALGALVVDWGLNDDGSVTQAGDEIAAYHEEGVGFGVLVKLYAMVAESQEACAGGESEEPCEAVSVADLIAALEGGAEMGDLFEQYGKPSVLGVGHVKGNGKDKNRGGADAVDCEEEGTCEGEEEGDGLSSNAGPKEKKAKWFEKHGDGAPNGGPPPNAGPKPKKNR